MEKMTKGAEVIEVAALGHVNIIADWKQPTAQNMANVDVDAFCLGRMRNAFIFGEAEVLYKNHANMKHGTALNWDALKWHADWLITARKEVICKSDVRY